MDHKSTVHDALSPSESTINNKEHCLYSLTHQSHDVYNYYVVESWLDNSVHDNELIDALKLINIPTMTW